MKYFLIAGESSGDHHASFLIDKIRKEDHNAEFEFWGGDTMASVTGKLPLKHIKELSFMGFTQVIKHLPEILNNFMLIKRQIVQINPDVVVFIDFPGFNLRLARWVKNHNYSTWYFISPSVWAWKSDRKEIIRKYIDRMMVIFPFEKAWYHQHQIEVEYVGNPTYERLKNNHSSAEFFTKHQITKSFIALLPGSRKQEITRLLPVMMEAVKSFTSDYEIVIAKADHLDRALYIQICDKYPFKSYIISGQTFDIMKNAKYGLITSGTATLEAAILQLPHLICYKTSSLNYRIAKMFVKLKWIGLPNIITNKSLIEEFIQSACNPENLKIGLQNLMNTSDHNRIYEELRHQFETTNLE